MGCILCCCKKEVQEEPINENLTTVSVITSAPTTLTGRSTSDSGNKNTENEAQRRSLHNNLLNRRHHDPSDNLHTDDNIDNIATISGEIDNKAFISTSDDQLDGPLTIYDANKNYRASIISKKEPTFLFSLEKTIPQIELMSQLPNNWQYRNIFDFHLHDLDENDSDYRTVKSKFDATTPYRMVVQNIQRIENLYLWLMYLLKKSELIKTSYDYKELQLFHGTKERNIKSIGLDNFDWRKTGSNYGSLFGCGISFSPVGAYSHYYTDQNYTGNTTILAKVLVARTCSGYRNMVLPHEGYDTSIKPDGKVYVKYDDHTYYPEFVITYNRH